MPLYKYVLLLFFVCVFANGYAQKETFTQYVIIDTVIDNRIFPSNDSATPVMSFHSFGYFWSDSNWSVRRSYPNFCTKITYGTDNTTEHSPSAQLLLDDFDGDMGLYHIRKYGDTIHIAKWVVYHNCFIDTVIVSTETKEYINDSLVKSTWDKKIDYNNLHSPYERGCVPIPDSIYIMINGKTYAAETEHRLGVGDVYYTYGYPTKRDKRIEARYCKSLGPNAFSISSYRYRKQKTYHGHAREMYAAGLMD